MNTDTVFILGLATGIAIAFLYDQVRAHQHRKRRRRMHREAQRDLF